MASFRIRILAGGAAGFILGAAHLLFEIEEVIRQGPNQRKPQRQQYAFTAAGATVGIRAGGYGPSQWTDFTASCGIGDFHGYATLSSIQGGPFGSSRLSINSGPAAGTQILGYGWGISTDASISFVHGWMRKAG